jgi:hypothetical protein
MSQSLLVGLVGIAVTVILGILGLIIGIGTRRKHKSFIEAGGNIEAGGDVIVGGIKKVNMVKDKPAKTSQPTPIPRYRKDRFSKHGVVWEVEVYSPNIDNHGEPQAICPKDHSDLVEVDVVHQDDVYYGNVDETSGEQIMRCPDCQTVYRFPFEFYDDLVKDIIASYRGQKRRQAQ